jgi:hypothetical protein
VRSEWVGRVRYSRRQGFSKYYRAALVHKKLMIHPSACVSKGWLVGWYVA